MPEKRNIPVALTIAGSDSGGGAGIQADLKTFAALGVHGTSAVTCITAQNPSWVAGTHACPAKFVGLQIKTVFEGLKPVAVKTGMLYSGEIVSTVAKIFEKRRQRSLLVVDPVMISTSGKSLLQASAIEILKEQLLPLATLVTPNLDEAARLTGRKLRSVEDMRAAARVIVSEFGCAALVKGGHLANAREAVDIFFDGKVELLLSAPFIKGVRTHGTGCTYSAAITGYLALGLDLPHAVMRAKEHVTQAIARHKRARGFDVLQNF